MSLSELTEEQLWMEYEKNKSKEIRNELVTRYISYVSYLVRRIIQKLPTGLTRDDLVQFGIYGLIEAVERFDSTQGATFKTYASIRIKGSIKDQIRTYGRYNGGLSRSAMTKAKTIDAAVKKLEILLKRHPTPQEVAKEMEMDIEEYMTLLNGTSTVSQISLDDIVGNSENLSVVQIIKDEKSKIPEEEFLMNEYHELLSKSIDELPEKERMVVIYYYYEELTLKEIGHILGLTEGRISQIHGEAMRKLKIKMQGE